MRMPRPTCRPAPGGDHESRSEHFISGNILEVALERMGVMRFPSSLSNAVPRSQPPAIAQTTGTVTTNAATNLAET